MQTSDKSTGNATLDKDIQRLLASGYEVETLINGPQIGVLVRSVALPPGIYNVQSTDVLLITDIQYPISGMDMFWVSLNLALESGGAPAGGDSIESHFGRKWRRFSWHRNTPWVPGRDDLVGHFDFAYARLLRNE